MVGLLTRIAIFLTLGLAAGMATGQAAGADPTRPPAGVVIDVASAASAEVAGPVLQSVLIPKKGRPVAVINGLAVRLGERYGESRLVRVSERGVVLDGPAGVEHLQLTPGIEKILIHQRTKENTKAGASAQRGGKP